MKIILIIAIKRQILLLKCTKFNFGWGPVAVSHTQFDVLHQKDNWE